MKELSERSLELSHYQTISLLVYYFLCSRTARYKSSLHQRLQIRMSMFSNQPQLILYRLTYQLNCRSFGTHSVVSIWSQTILILVPFSQKYFVYLQILLNKWAEESQNILFQTIRAEFRKVFINLSTYKKNKYIFVRNWRD